MTVFVDELSVWPRRTRVRSVRGQLRVKLTSHLTASTHQELMLFADRLGLPPGEVQDHPTGPYFELDAELRTRALELGAVFVPMKQQVIARVSGGPVRRLLERPELGRAELDALECSAIDAADAIVGEQEYRWAVGEYLRASRSKGSAAEFKKELMREKLDRLTPAMRKRYS